MAKKERKKRLVDPFLFSFPIQLLTQYFKSYQVLLLSWVLIILFVTNNAGQVSGIPYLFLDPEYLHQVNFWSFFICGVSFGTLVVSFHITGYILHGSKYRFLGVLHKPFSNFSVNNSLIPLVTLAIYLVQVTSFQIENEQSFIHIMVWVVGLITGTIFIVALLYSYFRLTNKNIYGFITDKLNQKLKQIILSRVNIMDRLAVKKKRKVTSFFGISLKLHHTDQLYHFPDKKAIMKVFDQNHLNSIIFVIILTLTILLMGYGIDYKIFQLPAAASFMFLMSMINMGIGCLAYWVKEWLITALVIIYIVMNLLFTSGTILDYHEAFGLDYHTNKAEYSLSKLREITSDSITDHDKTVMTGILNKWKSKQKRKKPIAVFLCVSGGGSRSALWTFNALREIDQQLSGDLMNKTVLITGASGGMVGASFFRELSYRAERHEIHNLYDQKYYEQIARDNLNPVFFNLVVNDLFLRNPQFEYANKRYTKDRGYAFEQQLNQNTDFIMDRTLSEYGHLESKGEIPMMVFGPSIMNDGRKLYISPHNTSFMNIHFENHVGVNEKIIDAVDFQRLFEVQGANDLKYTSALRMNASFPYITPNISLPSEPSIKVMDAGVTDNFGLTDAMRFIYVFKDWFAENTESIVFISIRDTKRVQVIEPQGFQSIFGKISSPINSVYNNLTNFQDINNEYKLQYMKSWYPDSINNFVIEYNMYDDYKMTSTMNGTTTQDSTKAKRPSLNWHLTYSEKQSLIRNIKSEHNSKTINSCVLSLTQANKPNSLND